MNKPGTIAALLDEYKTAIKDLQENIKDISDEELSAIADSETLNKNCVSIQSILTHIVFCGYNYISIIDSHKKLNKSIKAPVEKFKTAREYSKALDKMHKYNADFFDNVEESEMYNLRNKIKTSWGQVFDYDQLMEHAIMHVYRHRRQIKNFKEILRLRK